jgi:hypothetical protein
MGLSKHQEHGMNAREILLHLGLLTNPLVKSLLGS